MPTPQTFRETGIARSSVVQPAPVAAPLVGVIGCFYGVFDMPIDEDIIETPDGPMTWGEWKKRNPVQIPSRRTKGKKLPVKVKRFTDDR